MKTQLVNAIQLQEVELGETSTEPSPPTPAEPEQAAEGPEVRGEERITTTFTWEDEWFSFHVLCSPHRTEMLHRGGGGWEYRLRTLPRYAFRHHGQCQRKTNDKRCVFVSVLSPVTSIKVACACLDSGGDGDHVVGCGFSRDPLRVASGGLAGGFGFHGEEIIQLFW